MEEKDPKTAVGITPERRQNLPRIEHISATHTDDIDDVLSTLRACEEITLSPEQINMGRDIARSILEHEEYLAYLSQRYLIRYGILLEREARANREGSKEKELSGATNTEQPEAEQKSDEPLSSASSLPEARGECQDGKAN